MNFSQDPMAWIGGILSLFQVLYKQNSLADFCSFRIHDFIPIGVIIFVISVGKGVNGTIEKNCGSV